MPSKTQADVNLRFLYICLQKSDYNTIGFNAVGEATDLSPPAARMRFSRLEKAIETVAIHSIACPKKTGQSVRIEGKSKHQCKSRQAKSKGAIVKREEQMQDSNHSIGTPTMVDGGIGAESHTMIYNQHGAGIDCSHNAIEANYGHTDDDDIPLATKRKAAQCSTANKRQKQMKTSCPTGMKDDLSIDDGNIRRLSYKAVKQQLPSYPRLKHRVKNDELMALGDISSTDSGTDIPHTNQYGTTSMELTPAAPTTSLHEIVPEYILPFTNNNRQFTSRSEHEFSYDQHWSSWPSTISQMAHPHDPSAAFSRSARPTGYVRSPGMDQSSSTNPWAKYRIPSITITDTDPYGIRNPLYPGSINAVDKVQMAINEALFRPGSRAFDRSYVDSTEATDVPHH
ncbi:hypothetical protein AJ78_00552 [Emergomyces pasteurianus Ep9510]|uniref:Myb-like DNA-binding domain-containing protein n=1 Tax=Emergomyces pasteurianus Ep9510 TaxID=1447872 RepID=A0A1J9QUD9_9EURO|nr:hypothetical protein AJ78_00552 [Emergomyces pasteurianus Ep9510]